MIDLMGGVRLIQEGKVKGPVFTRNRKKATFQLLGTTIEVRSDKEDETADWALHLFGCALEHLQWREK